MDIIESFNVLVLKGVITAEQAHKAIHTDPREVTVAHEDPGYSDEQLKEIDDISKGLADDVFGD